MIGSVLDTILNDNVGLGAYAEDLYEPYGYTSEDLYEDYGDLTDEDILNYIAALYGDGDVYDDGIDVEAELENLITEAFLEGYTKAAEDLTSEPIVDEGYDDTYVEDIDPYLAALLAEELGSDALYDELYEEPIEDIVEDAYTAGAMDTIAELIDEGIL